MFCVDKLFFSIRKAAFDSAFCGTAERGKERQEVAEKILSVGIDIGTSTTSLVFSSLTIEKMTGDMYMPRTEITDRSVIYRSPVYFTPLRSNVELDAEGIREIVEKEYSAAGVDPGDVETGAVIITGDTARKVNAERVLGEISRFAGDFVVAAAGPSLESILAGKGSGAQQYSVDQVETICNMDIGGGTTNTAAFYDGNCIDADCLDVGGRLIRFSRGSTRIEYVFPKIAEMGRRLGVSAELGAVLNASEITQITDAMAEAVMGKLEPSQTNEHYLFLRTEKGENRGPVKKIDVVSFSGGVGKLVYEPEEKDKLKYGDIGVYLADSLKKAIEKHSLRVVKPKETISATVIGAGSHSVDVSGGTIAVTRPELLPLKNVPILAIEDPLHLPPEEFTDQVKKKTEWLQGLDGDQTIALNLKVDKKMGFQDVVDLAERVIGATRELMAAQQLLVVILYGDYGKVLGQSLSMRLPPGKEVICIDSVDVGDGDYIDIGRPVGVADSVPVVIKTIAFNY